MNLGISNARKKFSSIASKVRSKPSTSSRSALGNPEESESPFRAELYSPQQLERHAETLAAQHVVSNSRKPEKLLPRLRQNEKNIDVAYETVTKMVEDGARVPPAGEWLLDNYYVIKEHIGLAHEHLPRQFSKELPVLEAGSSSGLPRIYHMATELIAHVDGRVDLENLSSFINGYQKNASLTVGELWAIPIMLRLTLIENLRRVARRICAARLHAVHASKWSERLVEMAAKDPKNLVLVLADMIHEDMPMTSGFVAELCRGLQGQNPALALALSWFDQRLAEQGTSAEQLILSESQGQAADQVSIGNTITSLRMLGAGDWREFIEQHSKMEKLLREDPSGEYVQMDFETRDMYRHVVEKIAKIGKHDECDVARGVLALAGEHKLPVGAPARDARLAHIGYYLVDRGLHQSEKKFNCRIHSKRAAVKTGLSGRLVSYLFGMTALTVLITFPFVLALLASGASAWVVYTLGALFAFCAFQTALPLWNAMVTEMIPPQRLPKLDFSHGIPEAFRSIVAVPTMINNRKTVDNLAEGLEVRYLANRDANLYFALLTDFPDAAQESMPGDKELVEYACSEIKRLNLKYAADRAGIFYLLHRPRLRNDREKCWMGYERKRGKLAAFNHILRGSGRDAFMAIEGDVVQLKSMRYVITLDTDTHLPQNTGRKLAAAMGHVLNQPVYDENLRRIVSGYGIMQPRAALNLSNSRRSWFVQIFAQDAGIDPYTRAVSDVYQDLFGEGSFVGKGIYDVDAFEKTCSHFPENRILSHDLIEGNYSRAGLLSDVELFEDYPSRFNVDARRRHRWMRGDWQIMSWLMPYAPDKNGSQRNTLSALSRWKIFDNLRRSLIAPLMVVLLAIVWLALPTMALTLTLATVALLFVPSFFNTLWTAFDKGPKVPLLLHLQKTARVTAWSFLQAVIALFTLMAEAAMCVDAILRTLFRLMFSRLKLLEWQTASDSENKVATSLGGTYAEMKWSVLLTLVLGAAVWYFSPLAFPVAAPLLAIWLIAPGLCWVLSRQISEHVEELAKNDVHFLREVARRTWRFYSKFVTEEENWLPPDNFQSSPSPVIASRTSPTNIGAALLSTLAAFDFGYISLRTLSARLRATLSTMTTLERYHGHLLNWYDTRSLRPLHPQYVSTVDSGNLLGNLITLRGAVPEVLDARLLPESERGFEGLADSVRCLHSAILGQNRPDSKASENGLTQNVNQLLNLSLKAAPNYFERIIQLDEFIAVTDSMSKNIRDEVLDSNNVSEWIEEVSQHARDLKEGALSVMPWLKGRPEQVPEAVRSLERFKQFEKVCSLNNLLALAKGMESRSSNAVTPAENWRAQFDAGVENAQNIAGELDNVGEMCDELGEMKFDFLYDGSRKLLAIGYNVSDHRLDGSFYDLLASEARLASFICVAQGQLPVEHWFMLGRKLTTVGGAAALVSWSGSMFEYLMPTLLMPSYEGSLLNSTNKAVVARQIEYGENNNIPWGISESGYNARDILQNYQYRAFGVPGLGFKRGLSEDLVIAPYATVMSLMVAPHEACANLRRLASMNTLGAYGFHEAVDFTPSRIMDGQKFAIVESYMAHHQGMAMLALVHRLLDQPMQRRFFADPRLKAADLLLQERLPQAAIPIYLHSAEEDHAKDKPELNDQSVREFNTSQTPMPEVQLLSNGRYHVMVTNSGAGYSRWKDLALTRWREDGTSEGWGQFCYIRDLDSLRFHSVASQPVLKKSDDYRAIFRHSNAEFRNVTEGIVSHMSMCISPEDDVEVRQLKLSNNSRETRHLEITTFAEVVLNAQNADQAHPAFSNLFVQTEVLKDKNSLLCTRRPRQQGEMPPWLFHHLIVKGEHPGETSYETDRAKFIGRGRSARDPLALNLEGPLSNSDGSVLDPIVSVRRTVTLAAGESVEFNIVMGVAETREMALGLIGKFQDHRFCERAFEMAWTHSKVVLNQLNANESEAQDFCALAGPILHATQAQRASSGILTRNKRGQSGLWGYGISGDFPIVLLRVSDVSGVELARETLQAHAYLRMKGLFFDLVIWNEDASMYRQTMHDALMGVALTGSEAGLLDKPGGVFIRRGDLISEEDRVLLQTLARVTLLEGGGGLTEQVKRHINASPRLPRFTPTRLTNIMISRKTVEPVKRNLKFFNGLGGFSTDGREYVIELAAGQHTPAPWCNVLANAGFGTVVSESGSAYSWAENAHEYRLTPWHNDSLTDSSGEGFYLRDEETGRYWSPSQGPVRGLGAHVIRHGLGYSVYETTNEGIRSELTVFVPTDAPVKVMILKLRNESGEQRRMSATGFWEWVLGENRQKNAMHVITEVDTRSGAVFARNAFNADFQTRVSFCAVNDPNRGVTCDRLEFLGRNGSLAQPAAMRRARLSGRSGAGLDPCTALQSRVSLDAGQERKMVFVLGTAKSSGEALLIIQRFLHIEAAERALDRAREYWRHTCEALQVETPDPAMDVLVNGWLVYQVLACRVWARSGNYQSGGAYGFRDQLQDTMALTFAAPEITREHLLRCAARQFEEGDVQHWWHPPQGRGVRTQFSDDYLWLPCAVARYVLTLGDTGVLNERVPYITGRQLKPSQEEAYYDMPQISEKVGTLYEHAKLSLTRATQRMGKHGLPLMGCGDWNDGMNLVGIHGSGESVWLAFFLYDVLKQFGELARRMNDPVTREWCEDEADTLRANINQHAWDGAWYLRAFFDDGTPLGSASNEECKIDALPQSWSVLSKAGEPERSRKAMEAVDSYLVRRDKRLIQLFDPPFDKSSLNPGYIKAYVPGVRENGGQYTHGAIWTVMAYAEMGDVERAWELLEMLNPVRHGSTPEEIATYKVEPYVIAADVYGVAPHIGRGGWTWYTGSAGWMYRLCVETLLGVQREVDTLIIRPRLPKRWDGYTLKYRFRETNYLVKIVMTEHENSVTMDGVVGKDASRVPMVDDRKEHNIIVKVARSTVGKVLKEAIGERTSEAPSGVEESVNQTNR